MARQVLEPRRIKKRQRCLRLVTQSRSQATAASTTIANSEPHFVAAKLTHAQER
jgi:hypothetical protein